MEFISSILLLLLGVLGAANLIIARKPEAKELIAKLAPYQGWIGAIGALYGIWNIIHALMNMVALKLVPVWWISYLASGVFLVGLGLLFGVGVLKTFIKNEQAREKMDETIAKLAPKQGIMGIIALCVAIVALLARILVF